MKLNRSQKASLLKEIGNLISYFQTFEHTDIDKLINIMKEKYSSWKDANATELYEDVNSIVTTLQNLIEEKVIETEEEFTNEYSHATNDDFQPVEDDWDGDAAQTEFYANYCDDEKETTDITVTGSNNSTTKTYLSSEAAFFEDELISSKPEYETSDTSFSFTGFSSDNFQDTNAITISPKEFWYDEENKDDFND